MSRGAPPAGVPTWLWVAVAAAALFSAATFIVPALLSGRASDRPALDPAGAIVDRSAVGTLELRTQEDHPVTDDMNRAAGSLEGVRAPDFDLPDLDGRRHTLASLTQNRPLLMFFIEKQCPCCLGAKTYVDAMATAYKDHLSVVGIINAEDRVSRAWRKSTRPKFILLEDPEQTVIRAFKAERGVYTTLVRPDGTIEKAWAGYSQEMLADLGTRIARLAGVPFVEQEFPDAPTELTSGCLFPEPEPAPTTDPEPES